MRPIDTFDLRRTRPLTVALATTVALAVSTTPAIHAAEQSTGPSATPLEHRAVPGDDDMAIWSPEALAARYRRLSVPVDVAEPVIAESEQAWMTEALELVNTGEIEASIELIDGRRRADGSAMVDFMLGKLRFGEGSLEPAAAALSDAVEKAPSFRRAWMQLGLTLVQLGRFDEAREALAKAFSLGATDATTSGLLAFASSNAGRLAAAEEAYRRAILLDKQTLDWKRGLIITFFSEGRYAEAGALLGRLAREEPDNPDWWMFQANAFLGMQRPQDASQNFEVLAELGAATPESLAMLANIYVNDGLSSLAVDRYLEALAAEGEPDPKAAFQATQLMLRRGEVDEAARLLAGIRDCCMDGFDANLRKQLLKLESKVAVQRRDAEAEAAILERLVELDPTDGESMILLGEYFGRQSDGFEQAASWYEKAAAVPEHAARAHFQHGQLLVKAGRLADAIPFLDRSLEADPRDAVQQYRDQIADYVERTSG